MSEQKSSKTKLIVILGLVIGVIAVVAAMSSSRIPTKGPTEGTSQDVEAVKEVVMNTISSDVVEEETTEILDVDLADDAVVDPDPVVAVVNGIDVKRSEVLNFVNNLPPNMRQQIPPNELFPLAQEQLISGKIVEMKAEKADLAGNEDVANRLAEAKKQIVRAVFLEQEMEKNLSEDRVKAAYDEYVKGQGDVQETQARHILVDSEEKANDMINKLDGGADFVDLAKDHSKGPSGARGGDLGYFTEQDMVPEFSKAAFSTDIGKYTKKPIKTRFGWHVIKVEDRRVRPPADFEQVKPMLEAQERREILDELIQGWLDKADVQKFNIDGNPIEVKNEAIKAE